MMIFDTHAHYDDRQFDADRDALLASMQKNGVGAIVDVGEDVASWEKIRALTVKYPFIYGAAGLHPYYAADLTDENIMRLKEILREEKFVAVGEAGLDYHFGKADSEIQKKAFVRQLKLAEELKLPVIIHSRDAAADTMDLVKNHARGLSGVMHCYAYSAQEALQYAAMGFYIGVGGAVTFKKSQNLTETVLKVPLENLVLETDCPYLAPAPLRGTRNSSLNLTYVAQKVADIKGIPYDEVVGATYGNAVRLYRLQGRI